MKCKRAGEMESLLFLPERPFAVYLAPAAQFGIEHPRISRLNVEAIRYRIIEIEVVRIGKGFCVGELFIFK